MLPLNSTALGIEGGRNILSSFPMPSLFGLQPIFEKRIEVKKITSIFGRIILNELVRLMYL